MLRIHLLGTFSVERDGTPIPASEWPRRKTRALLKLLALQPDHRVHREQATELLWPDLDPDAARDNLYRNLSFLRHSLQPELGRPATSQYLTLSDEVLALGPASDVWIDVDQFERLIKEARAASAPQPLLEEAVALYKGDLLPEDAYEEWAIQRREGLRRLACGALSQLGSIHRSASRHDEAIAAYQRLLALDPTDEQAHRELMLAYALAGKRHDALRQYRQCADTLNTELGVEPEPETTALYERIRRGEIAAAPAPPAPAAASASPPAPAPAAASASPPAPAPAAAPPATEAPTFDLPEPATSFVGREREVEDARRLLGRADVRLLTFTGPAGIGKTRLAMQVARLVAADYPDGAVFVPLAPVRESELVLSAISLALSLKQAGDRPLLDSIGAYLRDKRMLMLLDNFEQVVSAAPYLSQLLSTAPGVKMLVTSRELLRLSAEHDYPVSPLPVPQAAQGPSAAPDALCDYPAVALFVARAGAVKPGFELVADNASAVAETCRRLDGIPLAIELAAARVRHMTPQALLSRLSSRLRLLTEGPRDLPARQQTLYAAINWSYELLAPEEQLLFAQLSVFAGGWTEEAAEAVCGTGGLLAQLTMLLDKSLLRQEEGYGGEPRFTMLETIREYASERLEAFGKTEAVRADHADYYLRLAQAGEAEWFTGRQHYWLGRFDEELHNFRAALTWALDAEPDLALRLAGALWRYWLAHAYLSEGRRWLEEAIARVPRQQDGRTHSDRAARAKALFGAGVLATHQADYAHASEMLAQSLGIARSLEASEQIANSLVGLSIVAHYTGEYRRAVTLLEEALLIFKRLEHPRGAALVLNSLSNSVLCLGDVAAAISLAEQSLELSKSVGDSLTVAASLTNIARGLMEQGDLDRAAALLEESLSLRRDLGDKGGAAHALAMAGVLALRKADLSLAAERFAQSLALRYEIGDREGMAVPLEGLGAVAAGVGDAARAARLYGAADALREAIGAPRSPADLRLLESVEQEVAALPDGPAWEVARAAGRRMTWEEAVAYALGR